MWEAGAKAAKAADLSARGVATAIASTVVTSLGSSSALAIAVTTSQLGEAGTLFLPKPYKIGELAAKLLEVTAGSERAEA